MKTIIKKDTEKAKKKKEKKEKRKQQAFIEGKKQKLINDWVSTMAHKGIYNQKYDTFILDNIKYHSFGFTCSIKNRPGLSFFTLEDRNLVNSIQSATGYRFYTSKSKSVSEIKGIFLSDTVSMEEYIPIELEPHELYFGKDIFDEPIIANQLKLPNVFVQGAVNMGKTKLIDLIMLNLLHNSKNNDSIDLYILQCDKYDQAAYNCTKQCKAYADKLDEQVIVTNYVYNMVLDLNRKIKPYTSRHDKLKADNFYEYNNLIKKGLVKDKPFKCSYLIIDEYAGIMPDREINAKSKEYKEIMQNNITEIIRLGRSVGVFCILSTQRGTVDMLPPLVKAMCNTNISFRVNNQASEQVAGFSGLMELQPREFKCRIDKEYMAATLTIKVEHFSVIDECLGNNKLNLKDYDYLIPQKKETKKQKSLIEELQNVTVQPIPSIKSNTKNKNTPEEVTKKPVNKVSVKKDNKPNNNKYAHQFYKVNKPDTGMGYDPNWEDKNNGK